MKRCVDCLHAYSEALAECPWCQSGDSPSIMRDDEDSIVHHTVRTFDTGATRSPLGDKLCYSGFLSPKVLKRFAQYMHLHRTQTDGTIRDPANWKKGITKSSYMDSMARHFLDVWMHMDGCGELAEEDMQTALCGLLFNVQGMMYEELNDA